MDDDDKFDAKRETENAFFAERRERADFAAFDRILARSGGVPPEGDDMP